MSKNFVNYEEYKKQIPKEPKKINPRSQAEITRRLNEDYDTEYKKIVSELRTDEGNDYVIKSGVDIGKNAIHPSDYVKYICKMPNGSYGFRHGGSVIKVTDKYFRLKTLHFNQTFSVQFENVVVLFVNYSSFTRNVILKDDGKTNNKIKNKDIEGDEIINVSDDDSSSLTTSKPKSKSEKMQIRIVNGKVLFTFSDEHKTNILKKLKK